ncbi:hypothetical protein A5853_002529, partial [Enterococcus faecium]
MCPDFYSIIYHNKVLAIEVN